MRSNSPGARTFCVVAGHEIDHRHAVARSPSRRQSVQTPSSAAVSEIIGPAGSDMQMFPPTVALFQILNEARKDRQHWRISGAALHSGGAATASSSATCTWRRSPVPGRSIRQRRPAKPVQVDQPAQVGLRFGKQPGAARQPGIAVTPGAELFAGRGAGYFGNGVEVHDIIPGGFLTIFQVTGDSKLQSAATCKWAADRCIDTKHLDGKID